MLEGEVEVVSCASEFDWKYEFSAPQYFDFAYEETQEDIEDAERWFDSAIPYEASLLEYEYLGAFDYSSPTSRGLTLLLELIMAAHVSKTKSVAELFTAANNSGQKSDKDAQQILAHVSPSPKQATKQDLYQASDDDEAGAEFSASDTSSDEAYAQVDPCTPECQRVGGHGLDIILSPVHALVDSPLPAKRLYSEAWASAKPVQVSKSFSKNSRLSLSRRSNTSLKKEKPAARKAHAIDSAQETQARKKQKLDGGRLKQIQVLKEQKTVVKELKPKVSTSLTVPQEFRFCTDTRVRSHQADHITPHTTSKKTLQRSQSIQVGRAASPFISIAERVRRFQQKTPERFHMLPSGVSSQKVELIEKPKLKLTRPKTPELETMQRSRPPRVKSAAEIEEELLAKLPKFKARPLPKKILGAPTLPPITKSTPQLPEFQEFHLYTAERAHQNPRNNLLLLSTSAYSTDSVDALKERRNSAPGGTTGLLTEPRPPRLHTAQRSRPTTVKTTDEMEAEELARVPKFKARPIDKRIFKSRGDLGLFRNHKRQITLPAEFHFKTGERAQVRCQALPLEEFSKLSLNRPPNTVGALQQKEPKPFHLATDDRGLAKKMRMIQEQIEREQKEVEARIPKAQLLPYTTDYPKVPPKPEPKTCTRPVPFQLVSVMRHEEEQQRMAVERAQAEQLEALLKEFRAQPNLSNAPVFVPVRSRKPLTEVHEFKFNVDTRAIERAEFDKKVTEKHNLYKQYREEYEAARKAEEEKFIRAMRREMVVVARPIPSFAKPFVPQRSSKEPTRPVSPQFSQKAPREEHRLGQSWSQEVSHIQRRIQMRGSDAQSGK